MVANQPSVTTTPCEKWCLATIVKSSPDSDKVQEPCTNFLSTDSDKHFHGVPLRFQIVTGERLSSFSLFPLIYRCKFVILIVSRTELCLIEVTNPWKMEIKALNPSFLLLLFGESNGTDLYLSICMYLL